MFSLRFNVSSLVNMFKLFLIIALMASVFVTVSSTDTCMECKDNEEYSECVNGGCDARNCSQLGNSVPCVKISEEDCIGGCICINGYLRDDNGTCIEKEQCPKCGGDPNAMPGCGVFCRQCSNYKSKTPLPCPDFCKINGCECKPNFIYDRNTGKCVKPQQCTPTCKANEVFSNCTNGGCDAKNCSQLGFPVPCIKIDPKNCIQGCVCQPNHLRADNGTCIPKTDCPSCGGDENAKSGCGVFCRQCKGNVICPKICKPNSCDCKPDFVYDPNINKCVKQSDCTPTCTDNEVFSNCTNGGSDARNCSQLGFPVPCIKKDPKACIKGCVCQQDYLRAANGTCIPKTECPSCGGDDNAQSGCGVFCRQCKGNVPCPRICKLNACDCKPDYVYDSNINKCVLRDQCTPTCNVNEEFSSCANGVCRLQNCSQYGQPIPYCPKFDTTKCKPGCICKNNFLRNDNGQCISQEQCM